MLSNGNKKNCGFEEEIVSYIYDEMVGSERTKFESHLSGCSVCTDEFAAISHARFSVFEWQKEEFRDLPTPNIVIPYEPQTAPESGWFDGLRAFLTGSMWPIAATASILVVIGFGLMYKMESKPEVVVVTTPKQTTTVSDASINSGEVAKTNPPVASPVNESEDTRTHKNNVTAVSMRRPKGNEIRPVNAVANSRPRIATPITTRKDGKALVLSDLDDSDDNSLRLSDLLDSEVGEKL